MQILSRRLALALVFLILSGTSCAEQSLIPDQYLSPPQNRASKDSGWSFISESIEIREQTVLSAPTSSEITSSIDLLLLRFSPDLVEAKLHYQALPIRMEEWQTRLLTPSILINGGFFDENFLPTGLFLLNGEVISKQAYDPQKSGTVLINQGLIQLIDTSLTPLPDLDEQISLLQSFPFLIKEGQGAIQDDSGLLARRTVIAETKNGQIILLIIDKTPVSLFNLMNILLNSDLEIEKALNLDGGPSTTAFIQTDDYSRSIVALSPLPQVLSFQD